MEDNVHRYFQKEHIELLRKKMMEEAEIHGFHHPLVHHYSQRIDQEHNRMLGLHAPKDLFPSKIYPTRKNWQIV